MKLQGVMRGKLLTRRNALKSAIVGTGIALPLVGNIPGVSAASLGYDQQNVKVLPLTGKLLRQEEKKLRATSSFAKMEAFVSQKGLAISDPLTEGYYLYRQTGNHWSQEIILSVSYLQSQGSGHTATVTYSQNSQEHTLDIVLANPTAQTAEGYAVRENGSIELVAQLKAQGDKSELLLVEQYEQSLQANVAQPNSIQCNLCRAVCFALVSTGCSILGAAFTCGRVCLPFGEDPPCLALCAIAYRIVCSASGGFDCLQLVCVRALHAC